ncbi:MAG: aromatic/alkene monooxygenase hydroxylase subunit beta [Kangiellaceae bacterium]|nr:aromatic/alkene monooxygenase hydroxylase subunit beta [Kangiellaceae bacterium]
MSEQQPEVLKPLKTWSHLAGNRRKPSEYEIVSTNLHYHTNNKENPWELDPDIPMAKWYRKYRNDTPLKHEDWDLFRDPDQLVYRTYNLLQDGQETYVSGLLDQFNERGHDLMLTGDWISILNKLYTPSRYLFHTLQLAAAYLAQISPSSTITNCATFQAADGIRWMSHSAYRTRELANSYGEVGFGENERKTWEQDSEWQGFRELMEKSLIVWDWSEAFVAINRVARPATEEAVLIQFGLTARNNDDTLLGLLTQAQMRDGERHRRWASELVKFINQTDGNHQILQRLVDKWQPLAVKAIEAFCAGLPDSPNAAKDAIESTNAYRQGLGLK